MILKLLGKAGESEMTNYISEFQINTYLMMCFFEIPIYIGQVVWLIFCILVGAPTGREIALPMLRQFRTKQN